MDMSHLQVKSVYEADPLARLIIEKLRLKPQTVYLVGLAWSLVFLFVLPAMCGCLRTRNGHLGSMDDWHARLLLLLTFPTACSFYVWQPGAMARVYATMLRANPGREVSGLYRRRVWPRLSLLIGLGVVLFDFPHMAGNYGAWWMAHSWVIIAAREASLAVAFYVLSMMAWRQVIAIMEWNQLLSGPGTDSALRAVTSYGLSWALLLAILGLRLSIEGIELPRRAGAITPDYYAKVGIYVTATLACFFAPVAGAQGQMRGISIGRATTLCRLVAIMALPLLGYLALKLILS